VAASAPGRDGFQAIFLDANRAYLDGEYERSIAGYQKLVEAGLVHPDLYFNLANAFYRAGRIGLAVLFYEKTLALDPSDAAAKSNLEIVRKELIDRVVLSEGNSVGEPMWHGFIRSLNLGGLIWFFLVLWTLVFGLWSLRRLMTRPALRRLVFWVSVPLVSVTLVLGLLLAARIYVQERVHHGVVVETTVALREGPERTAKELMEVHAGLKIRLLNQVGDYVRVRLANGVEGFVLDRQLGRI
jgi:tetratricopeptide (TPR) repeat protein